MKRLIWLRLFIVGALVALSNVFVFGQTGAKKRYEDADRRMNESYQQTLTKIDKEQQTSLRDDQRHWLRNREAGAKFYKESGGKSTPKQRYWQYMLDSTEVQLRHLDTDWKSQTE